MRMSDGHILADAHADYSFYMNNVYFRIVSS